MCPSVIRNEGFDRHLDSYISIKEEDLITEGDFNTNTNTYLQELRFLQHRSQSRRYDEEKTDRHIEKKTKKNKTNSNGQMELYNSV